MRAMSSPDCLGTVVVHRSDAVTCTSDACQRDLPLESWFTHHASFVTCRTDGCPHCGSDTPAQVGHGDGNATSSAARWEYRCRGHLLEP